MIFKTKKKINSIKVYIQYINLYIFFKEFVMLVIAIFFFFFKVNEQCLLRNINIIRIIKKKERII